MHIGTNARPPKVIHQRFILLSAKIEPLAPGAAAIVIEVRQLRRNIIATIGILSGETSRDQLLAFILRATARLAIDNNSPGHREGIVKGYSFRATARIASTSTLCRSSNGLRVSPNMESSE